MKKCPYCAEEIQEEAIRCKHCFADLTAPSPVAETKVSPDAPATSNNSIPKLLGIIGSAILFIGVFMPIVSAPIVGSQNYFQNGKGDGIIIIALSLASLLLTLGNKYRGLWVTGLGSLGVLGFTYYNINSKIKAAKEILDSELSGNPFRGLADVALQSFQIQWGFAILIIGALLIISAAFLHKSGEGPESKDVFTLTGKHIKIIVAVAIAISLAFFYYNYSVMKSDIVTSIKTFYGYDEKHYSYYVPLSMLITSNDRESINVNYYKDKDDNRQFHETSWYVHVKKEGSRWVLDDFHSSTVDILNYLCKKAIASNGISIEKEQQEWVGRDDRGDLLKTIMMHDYFIEYFAKGKDLELAKNTFNIRYPKYKL